MNIVAFLFEFHQSNTFTSLDDQHKNVKKYIIMNHILHILHLNT